MNESVATRTEVKTQEERRRILDQEANAFARPGGGVTYESSTAAVVTKGKPLNVTIHLILTVITLGIWGIVWFVLAKTGGEKRWRVTVNEYGQTNIERL